MARPITEEEKQYAQELLQKARKAMKAIEDYEQATIDRLCQAVGWATANEKTFTRLAQMGVDESGMGDRAGRPGKRFKIINLYEDCKDYWRSYLEPVTRTAFSEDSEILTCRESFLTVIFRTNSI